jgi:putative membrane protein
MAIRCTTIAAITALLTATPIVAQPQTTGDTDAQPQTTSPGTSTPGSSSTTDSGDAADTMTSGSNTLQGQDATFLRKAMEADRMEIASAQAALDRAQRTDTRNGARMILEDHQASSQQLQSLASRKGWTLPSAASAMGTASAEADQPTSGAPGSGSFDDRFVAEQIRMHREAIELYRAQASSGSDPDLRRFARDQLPHLEHHLETLQGSNTQK